MADVVVQLPTNTGVAKPAIGQFNLFTAEVEPIPGMGEPEPQPETPWLFDPDFGLVLPEDRAGKEILVEEGITLSFPGEQVTGYRGQVTGNQVYHARLRGSAFANH